MYDFKEFSQEEDTYIMTPILSAMSLLDKCLAKWNKTSILFVSNMSGLKEKQTHFMRDQKGWGSYADNETDNYFENKIKLRGWQLEIR